MFFSVIKFIGILLEVLLIFNLLIIVHELGHFLAAKWRGLYIERFGIWFGKPIWEKKINGIWYSLGSIPAGGFVKLPQLAPMEAIEGETEIPKDQLKPISPLDKIIVAFAGPLFSFMLACVFAILVWQLGKPVGEADSTTIVGDVVRDSPADGKLQPGDEIVKIDDHSVNRWGGQSESSVMWRVVGSEGKTIEFDFKRGEEERTVEIEPKIEKTSWHERRGFRQVGVIPQNRPMVMGTQKGSTGEKAKFQKNDLITHVGGQKVYSWESLTDWAKANPGKPLPITVLRNGSAVELVLEPNGFVVGEVFPDSPASRGGLKKGDRILSANGTPTPFASIFM